MQTVVEAGTGKRAAYGGFAAGKTGTTEDFGDAWFVGFTHELTIAVWVGYPDSTRSMKTEFGGEPVAGGTFPAQIWRDFVVRANQILNDRKLKASGATGATGADLPLSTSSAPATGASPITPDPAATDGTGTGGKTKSGQQKDGTPADKPKPAVKPKPTPPVPTPTPPPTPVTPPSGGDGGGGVSAPPG